MKLDLHRKASFTQAKTQNFKAAGASWQKILEVSKGGNAYANAVNGSKLGGTVRRLFHVRKSIGRRRIKVLRTLLIGRRRKIK